MANVDVTSILVKLLPACALPKLKFLVTILGGIATSVVVTYPHADPRYAIAAAALTAVSTYFTPNVQPVKIVGGVATQAVDPSEGVLTYSNCCQPTQEAEKPAPAPVTVQAQAPVTAAPTPPPVKEVGV